MVLTTQSEVIRIVQRYLAKAAAKQSLSPSNVAVVEQFAATYQRILERYCGRAAIKRMGISRQDQVAELVQIVWSAVLRQLPKFQYDRARGRFRSWLYVILRRQAAKAAKNAMQQRHLGGQPLSSVFLNNAVDARAKTPLQAMERQFDEDVLKAAVHQLKAEATPREFGAFRRCLVDGAAAVDVAAELGLTPSNVRNALYRARQRFKRILRELTGDDELFIS